MGEGLRIGVVGSGASAVCLLDALAQADCEPGSITLFESAESWWRGRPFQDDDAVLRVNAPPQDMSVRDGDTGHFARWLAVRGAAWHEDPFTGTPYCPRSVFGEYLEESARTALRRLAERGWSVRLLGERVNSAVACHGGVRLQTSNGQQVWASHVVLCVGGGRPADPYGLTGRPGFVADPYPIAHQFESVAPDTDVAVLGSGLTGVDAVLALAARGHRGRIHLVSRTGALPAVRQRPVEHPLRLFTRERLNAAARRNETMTVGQLTEVMRAELASAGEALEAVADAVRSLTAGTPVSRLRRALAGVDSPSLALRIVQRAVPEAGPDVWTLLPEHEKSALTHSWLRTVMSLCCPMPPTSAAGLVELAESGQLRFVHGVRGVAKPSGEPFRISASGGRYRATTVINAVPPHRAAAADQPLIKSLARRGIAELHPRGGVRVDPFTSRFVVGGTADPRWYALGDLAGGSLFFTFGVPSLVDRARDISNALLEHLRSQSSMTRVPTA